MLPEGLIITLIVFPVCLHIRQKSRGPEGLQNLGDAGVLPGTVASCVKRTITWLC